VVFKERVTRAILIESTLSWNLASAALAAAFLERLIKHTFRARFAYFAICGVVVLDARATMLQCSWSLAAAFLAYALSGILCPLRSSSSPHLRISEGWHQ